MRRQKVAENGPCDRILNRHLTGLLLRMQRIQSIGLAQVAHLFRARAMGIDPWSAPDVIGPARLPVFSVLAAC